MRLIRRLFLPVLLLSMVLLEGGLPVRAETQLDAVLTRGVLRAAMPGDYRPFAIRSADGKYEGLDVDMAEALAKSLGVKLEIVPTRWAVLLDDLKADKYDIGMAASPSRWSGSATPCSQSRCCAPARRRSRAAPTRRNTRPWPRSTVPVCASWSIPAARTSVSRGRR